MDRPAPFHLMAKPAGPACNLDCDYCFYLQKQSLFRESPSFRMSDPVLERFIRDYIASQPGREVTFAWQGGEPTLLGVDFYRRVIELQQRHAAGKKINNSFQTNGTLLDDTWGAFLHEHHFLVGISIDGPRDLHDRHRRDKHRRPTFSKVMQGLAVLQRHHVDYNLLTVVSSANVGHPLEVYRFLKDTGAKFLQFIPLVEPDSGPSGDLDAPATGCPVTAATPDPDAFGRFLCAIFDQWSRRDVGRVFIQAFDMALGIWLGLGSSLCVHAETCGSALAVEHNGDIFACDHFVYPSHRRGNLLETPLARLVASPAQQAFGREKHTSLPRACRECPVLFACQGGCPKHRIRATADGDPGLNYLCAGYRRFFTHIDPVMRRMVALHRAGRPAADIMAPAKKR